MSEENRSNKAASQEETSALFVKARKKQLAEQEEARREAEEEARRLAAEEEVRRLEEQVARRKREAEEEAKRLEEEAKAKKADTAAGKEKTAAAKSESKLPERKNVISKPGISKPAISKPAIPKPAIPKIPAGSGMPDKKILLFGGIGAAVAVIALILVLVLGGGKNGGSSADITDIARLSFSEFWGYDESAQHDVIDRVVENMGSFGISCSVDEADEVWNNLNGLAEQISDEEWEMEDSGILLYAICLAAGADQESVNSYLLEYGYDFGRTSGGGTMAVGEFTESALWNIDGGRTVYYPPEVNCQVQGEGIVLSPVGYGEEYPWTIMMICVDGRSNTWSPGELQNKEGIQTLLNDTVEALVRNTGYTVTAMSMPASQGIGAMNSMVTASAAGDNGENLAITAEARITYWGSIYIAISTADLDMGGNIDDTVSLAAALMDGIE